MEKKKKDKEEPKKTEQQPEECRSVLIETDSGTRVCLNSPHDSIDFLCDRSMKLMNNLLILKPSKNKNTGYLN